VVQDGLSQIDKNSIFWVYRTQSVADKATSGIPVWELWNGPIADKIYVTANVVQPGVLTVISHTLTTTFDLSSGSTAVQAPFTNGNPPAFNFTPNGKNCAALIGNCRDLIGSYTYSPGGRNRRQARLAGLSLAPIRVPLIHTIR
jgi:hypothetical protein